MDLVIVVILLLVVVLAFKTFSSFVYFTAIIDLFFRIMTLVRYNIGIKEISNFIGNYIPESIPARLIYFPNAALMVEVVIGLYGA